MDLQFYSDLFSIVLNCILIIGGLYFLTKKYRSPLGYYLLATLLLQFLGDYIFKLGFTNLYLFSISYYLNFLYISYYYFKYIIKIPKKVYYSILIAGSIPMWVKLLLRENLKYFEAYDWIIYDAYIVILALTGILKVIQNTKADKNHLLISFFILAFFGLDFSVAFTMNYLVNGKPDIVLWIWHVRAIVLIGYFLTLSICTWKILKKA